MRVVAFSQGLFAIASASLAVLIWVVTYDSPPGGQSSFWREAWVYGSALLVLAASVGLFFSRTASTSALTIGAYQAIRTVIHAPQIFSGPLRVGTWYGFFEAVTALVGAWLLYVILRWQSRGPQMPIAVERTVRVALVLFGLCCVFYGWSHFAYADYTASLVPTLLPARLGLAYLTGLGHCAAGIGLTIGILPRLAATLEAIMMTLFGLLVWVPSFFAQPRPLWATPPEHQWTELVTTIVLAASAWVVAASLSNRSWGFARR